MYKNQLQELAQRSCFNLPSYACMREGPDHAPRFKASVNFNGEIFESPSYCSTVRQAEHSAAEAALISLSSRGPSRSLTARVLDETGIYKNLLQETAHRAGLNLPVYTSIRSGPGHIPTFTCRVELAGLSFTGEPAKTKKQAEKNAAISAWSALKKMQSLEAMTEKEGEEKEQEVVARVLSSFRPKEAKRRDQYNQNQARRRTIRSHKDRTEGVFVLNEKWRLMNLLIRDEGASSSSSQHSPKHQPRKPLISSASSSPLHEEEFKGKVHQDFAQRSDAKQERIIKPFPLSSMSGKSISNVYSPTHNNNNSYSKHLHHRGFYTGGGGGGVCSFKPQRMAPAVQIRSVIPVCATPPQTTRHNNPNPTSTSSSSTSSLVNESSTSRTFCSSVQNVLGNPEKCPSQLSYDNEIKKLGL